MHRWFGSKEDSAEQASNRDRRAAQRTINSLTLQLSSEDENEEYEDCNLSIHHTSIFSLDGANDDDLEDSVNSEESSSAGIMALTAAQLAVEKAKAFEDASYPDDDEAWKKDLKIKFDKSDVEYWFNSVESQMKKFGINSQWSKKDAIAAILPEDVIEECKPILRLTQDEAGT